MLARSYIERILDQAVSCKVDYAEVFFEDVERTKVDLIDSEAALVSACLRDWKVNICIVQM